MQNKLSILAIVLSVIALGSNYLPKTGEQATQQTQVKESVYERIMRTRTVRCAYLIWPPYLNKDTNTGKLSGVYYDLMERMAKDWSMKIEWAEEVGAANRFEGFATGRYDLLCSPVGGTAERTSVSDFSRPFVYHPFSLYAREGDNRFDNNHAAANNSEITLATLDGYIGAAITKRAFPNAKVTSLPNLSTESDILLGLSMGKADAAVCDAVMAQDYIKNNPGKIKRVAGPPVSISTETIALPVGEPTLRQKINISLDYYLDTGVIETILNTNGLEHGKVLRIAKPYQE